MSLTSSKLGTQGNPQGGAGSPKSTVVETRSEPVAEGSNAVGAGAKLSRDVRRIQRLRQHSTAVIRRIELGIEAMRSDIGGSSLVDTQQEARMQGNLDVLLRLYRKVYNRLQVLQSGTRLSDVRKAVNISEFARYQSTLLSELRRLVLQSESREIRYSFRLLKKCCSSAVEKTHRLLNPSRETSDEHILSEPRLPEVKIETRPEPKSSPQSPRYNRRLLGRKKLRDEAAAVDLEKLEEKVVKRRTPFRKPLPVSLRSSSTTRLVRRFRKAQFRADDIQKMVDERVRRGETIITDDRLSEVEGEMSRSSATGATSQTRSESLSQSSNTSRSSSMSSRATISTMSSFWRTSISSTRSLSTLRTNSDSVRLSSVSEPSGTSKGPSAEPQASGWGPGEF